MADVLASNLSEKAVMGSDGTELGTLDNISMDIDTGTLTNLLVLPNEALAADQVGFDRDGEGRFLVPVSRVQAVKDYVVVDR